MTQNSEADSRKWARQWMREIAQTPAGMVDLCNLARAGWSVAHETCVELIAEHKHNRTPMPMALEAYAVEVVLASADQGRRHRLIQGKQRADTFLRDLAVVAVVADTCWRFGLNPTRNAESMLS